MIPTRDRRRRCFAANYLALLGEIDVLPALFTKILIPPAVHREFSRPKTPPAVLAWASALPVWCEVRPLSSAPLVTLAKLDDGERDAIQLAIQTGIGILLMDEREGRREEARHHLKAIGTLSILEAAAAKGLLDFRSALANLEATNFRLSSKLRKQFVQRNP